MKFVSIFVSVLFAGATAFAGSVDVEVSGPSAYKTVKIEAKRVKGVQVVLSKKVQRTDCNEISLSAEAVRVSGNEMNWWATFFVTTGLSSTEMYCPLPEPVTETVSSAPMVFESYTNENLDSEVLVTLIVPDGYGIDVQETK